MSRRSTNTKLSTWRRGTGEQEGKRGLNQAGHEVCCKTFPFSFPPFQHSHLPLLMQGTTLQLALPPVRSLRRPCRRRPRCLWPWLHPCHPCSRRHRCHCTADFPELQFTRCCCLGRAAEPFSQQLQLTMFILLLLRLPLPRLRPLLLFSLLPLLLLPLLHLPLLLPLLLRRHQRPHFRHLRRARSRHPCPAPATLSPLAPLVLHKPQLLQQPFHRLGLFAAACRPCQEGPGVN